jgi:hypothetical protein
MLAFEPRKRHPPTVEAVAEAATGHDFGVMRRRVRKSIAERP